MKKTAVLLCLLLGLTLLTSCILQPTEQPSSGTGEGRGTSAITTGDEISATTPETNGVTEGETQEFPNDPSDEYSKRY